MPMLRGRKIPKGYRVLRGTPPSAAIEDKYRARLQAMVKEMHESCDYWIRAAYKNNEPFIATLAQDAPPSEVLRIAVSRLVARWQERFNEAADRLAEYFAKENEKRSTVALKRILKEGGWTIPFTTTPAVRDIMASTISQNVSLIKSIPSTYFFQVEQLVQRSVQQGGDLKQLTDDLMDRYHVARNRAELIARDQNSKASSAFTRARRLESGIEFAVWQHSHGGEVPRPTHVAMNGRVFSMKEGMYDPAVGKYIFPGSEINCRCYSKPVVRGFE